MPPKLPIDHDRIADFCRRWRIQEQFGRKIDLVEKKALRNPFRRQTILADQQVVYAA